MARLDVYANPDGAGLLVDVQADLLSHLNTRLVVPLLPQSIAPMPAKTLNPCFNVAGETVVMITQFMAAVPTAILRDPVTSLRPHRDEITAALDFLIQGF
ncbi:CcdB family protein [Thioalkalivibrio sp.]|uniref:CcdB family protein n=1 Tax=Thioalkalivibrio sp. TaxID=2093813 RepID=UPI0012D57127|nr:CcdB family protein [Thioalkalivibrio sp.]TVP80534.1 MAG: plasmid maintenance protein CcdB [Thioalkalivibrio sp.]